MQRNRWLHRQLRRPEEFSSTRMQRNPKSHTAHTGALDEHGAILSSPTVLLHGVVGSGRPTGTAVTINRWS